MSKRILATLMLIATFVAPTRAESVSPPLTMSKEFSEAALVMVGRFAFSKLGANEMNDKATEFIIEEILKPHELVKDKKSITLPRFLVGKHSRFVVFAGVYKGELEYCRRVPIAADSAIVKYLKEMVSVQAESQPQRLRFFFDYLNSPEYDIALDAYLEFAQADPKDYQFVAKSLPKGTLVSWINDPTTPSTRLDLFGLLLGHCGGMEEAKVLKAAIGNPKKVKGGADGLMAGLVLIDPKDGWAFLNERMLDPKQDVYTRFGAFRTACALWETKGKIVQLHEYGNYGGHFATRISWETRRDLLPKETLVKSMGSLMESGDMGDFAIDELRKWKRWEFTHSILKLWDEQSHNNRFIKVSIGKFMVRSPERAAAAFIAEQRRRDSEWVKDVEDLLSLETN